ncbi:Ser/Thr protein phosphatase, putative [Trichomonas vaginalis G3]|uniref:Serine/threonine-protein phosphatase n=1 Tax=Trichomonas vaginalis (strain ATCC PRA-98 / G3) TaxID=412133 RepID=A2DX90_TRIV3|nr:phosphoprotein phosphatase protein [Trichomonas vaginalis G3]EAY14972.1 Ser/Thr protein phosphatase, putative [Trichomonas vaginalis G3]KAI5507355.1 phosphoprotein phosphatase protein [Trichomonas vaginalis G3]|eukprot:XP_001327195.1 Ser/Thr protein phosphatase [Trichomonas vaginalis G3]
MQVDTLDQFIDDLMANKYYKSKIPSTILNSLITSAIGALQNDPIVLKLKGPINVCGDVHGQFNDLLRVFQRGGMPKDSTYLFLGDYVDRGPQSLEVICLLYALKIRYPTNVYLIRGNHESPEMSEVFGFLNECKVKTTVNMWVKFCDSFRYLPLAAIVNDTIFCIHGGISPELKTIEQITAFKRPLDIPDEGLLANILWSDPNGLIDTWGPNERGTTVCWGPIAAKKFMQTSGMTTIIRGHQLAMNGYDFPFGSDKSVITIFTASKYAGQCNNKAAFLIINANSEILFSILPSWNPVILKARENKVHPGTPRKRASLSPRSRLVY